MNAQEKVTILVKNAKKEDKLYQQVSAVIF